MPNSKRKGNRFERLVSQWLTEWSGYKFQRTPYSGANHFNRDLASDIMCSDEKHSHKCSLSFECKSYKDIRFEHVLLGTKGCDIEKFWRQAKEDANRAKKLPLLIMRYNSMPREEFFLAVSQDLAQAFLNPSMQNQRYMVLNIEDETLYVFMASAVKEYVSYKDIHKYSRNLLKTCQRKL